MNRLALLATAGVVLVAGAARVECNNPAAQTPIFGSLQAILTTGGPCVGVGADPQGNFDVLPSGLPSGGVQVFFRAPLADQHCRGYRRHRIA